MSVAANGFMHSSQASLGRRTSPKVRLLATLFVVSFAFDFKGDAGGSLIQYAMAGINFIAFLLLAARYRMVLPGSGIAAFVFWGWICFLIAGSAGALISSVPFGHYMRTIYPFVLFMLGFLVAWWVARDARGAASLVSAMTFSAVLSLFFTLWWGFHFTGASAETIRYQILSPLIPFLIVAVGYDLFFALRRRFLSFSLLALILGIVGLSVTRGALLVTGMVALAVLGAWLWNVLRGAVSLPRPFVRAFSWGIAIGILGVAMSFIFAPDVAVRWINRSLGAAHDVAFWTRVAAVIGQWDQLASHPVAWFAGRGFGQSYHYSQLYASLVIPAVEPTTFYAAMWYPGEFMWMTPLYYGGYVAGALAITILLRSGLYAFRALTILLHQCSWLYSSARPIWLGALGYFAFLGLGFTANPFITRLSALYMGLTLGVTIAVGRRLCCESNQKSHDGRRAGTVN